MKVARPISAPNCGAAERAPSAGQTNQIYIGLVRTWELFRAVFKPDDAIFLEGALGGTWNDGKIDVIGTAEEGDWKS